jgi:diguanylate cyclase (GGDEF)-like protein
MHEEVLSTLLDAAEEGILVFAWPEGAKASNCRFAGRRVGEIFGIEPEELIGRTADDALAMLGTACTDPLAFRALALLAPRAAQDPFEVELERPSPRTLRVRSVPLPSGEGDGGFVALITDVTAERAAERRAQALLHRLEEITATDALTQLPNRRRFLQELEREHGRASRAWDSYAVLRCDVDGLGSINEAHGRVRGDELLEAIAERLRSGRREYDVLARLADDELGLLVPGADLAAARAIAERAVEAVATSPFALPGPTTVTISIGAAIWKPPSGEDGHDVLRRAGEALAAAQRGSPRSIVIDGDHARDETRDDPR